MFEFFGLVCLLPLGTGLAVAVSIWALRHFSGRPASSPRFGHQVVASVVLLIGVGALLLCILDLVVEINFGFYSRTTTALVLSRRVETHTDSEGDTYYDYYVTYQFRPTTPNHDAAAVTQEERVTYAVYNALGPGASITIRHLPNPPYSARVNSGLLVKPWVITNNLAYISVAVVSTLIAFWLFGVARKLAG